MQEFIDIVLRTKDESGRIRFWHLQDIDLESIKLHNDKLKIPQKLLRK